MDGEGSADGWAEVTSKEGLLTPGPSPLGKRRGELVRGRFTQGGGLARLDLCPGLRNFAPLGLAEGRWTVDRGRGAAIQWRDLFMAIGEEDEDEEAETTEDAQKA